MSWADNDTLLTVLVVLGAIVVLFTFVSAALWVSKKIRIPVTIILIVSLLTGGLGFFIFLIWALILEDKELMREDSNKKNAVKKKK